MVSSKNIACAASVLLASNMVMLLAIFQPTHWFGSHDCATMACKGGFNVAALLWAAHKEAQARARALAGTRHTPDAPQYELAPPSAQALNEEGDSLPPQAAAIQEPEAPLFTEVTIIQEPKEALLQTVPAVEPPLQTEMEVQPPCPPEHLQVAILSPQHPALQKHMVLSSHEHVAEL